MRQGGRRHTLQFVCFHFGVPPHRTAGVRRLLAVRECGVGTVAAVGVVRLLWVLEPDPFVADCGIDSRQLSVGKMAGFGAAASCPPVLDADGSRTQSWADCLLQVLRFLCRCAGLGQRPAHRLRGTGAPVVDLIFYHSYTTEPLLSEATSEKSEWFWEPAHYKVELGDRMLERIYGLPTADPNMGVRLTSANVDDRLKEIVAGLQRWLVSQTADDRWVTDLVRSEQGHSATKLAAGVGSETERR